jgi:hypothetical protein
VENGRGKSRESIRQPVSKRIKKTILWGAVGVLFYFLLTHHIVFVGSNIRLLKKSHLTLEYTIFSTQGKTNESIMGVDQMRRDGIGDLLVDMGRMSQQELDRLLDKYQQ